MHSRKRPLAPHVQVYRPQLTSVLSFCHRLSGIALGFGALLIVVWLLAGRAGPEAYHGLLGLLLSPLGSLLLFAWSFALFYHLCNGIRHLVWDSGHGFSLTAIYASGWAVVGASLTLTLCFWLAAGMFARGAP
ncbi:succinate dehydrogenase, cytochrome b556 subunit [Algiphilus aromaticivorans]|uniref:succinate dehydrogenase, cytochrome b556 subunit n=1 Tax=Algiphilus aromaticivorans TaxID=382454 RepID=UPI0005C14CCD|nr:succinate dehydrogenase, cytochrome b556 subunit [Algiphilus aromaticivorans]